MMKDLVLEWEGGAGYGKDFQVILPNIQGQKYVFGTKYPGDEKEGEEFIFTRNKRLLIDSTHFVIRVDELGQYWIQNDTTKFKTFVNSERLFMEPRLLGIGDIVLLEDSEMRCEYPRRRHLFFYIEERIVPGSGLEIQAAGSDSDNDSEECKAMKAMNLVDRAESPLDNSLILSEIMSYLPVWSLKDARQVSKEWKEEASKALGKKGMVSFEFNRDYENPENSTKVIRYLHEMRDMKLQNLHITLRCVRPPYSPLVFFSPREPGQKMVDDLRKLLNSSHSFSTLFLEASISGEAGFFLFSLIFQELGAKLVELKLDICRLSLPAVLPPLPLMSSLKKLIDTGERFREAQPKWVSHIVPLFSNNLEHFTCSGHTADTYLQEFLKHPTPNLKGISLIKDKASETTLSALLELETSLTFLEIRFSEAGTEPEELLQRLLLKHSESLQHLVIRIGNDNCHNKDTEVSFPPFPKLVDLEVEYDRRTRIGWGQETRLDYEDHFPSLRKLTVRPLEPWGEDDQVFNAFFQSRELRCETVTELCVPIFRDQMLPIYWHYGMPLSSFQLRMNEIREMFPSAGKINFFQ